VHLILDARRAGGREYRPFAGDGRLPWATLPWKTLPWKTREART
jgi:hypothetical protein